MVKAIAANRENEFTSLEGTVLIGEDGRRWQLMAPFSENEFSNKLPKSPWGNPDNFYPAFDLPEASEIVISKAEVERFEAQFAEPESKPEEKQLTTNERNTLLVLIAALCERAGIDPKAKGAAGQLVKFARDEANVELEWW
jgi:hypothetical protein